MGSSGQEISRVDGKLPIFWMLPHNCIFSITIFLKRNGFNPNLNSQAGEGQKKWSPNSIHAHVASQKQQGSFHPWSKGLQWALLGNVLIIQLSVHKFFLEPFPTPQQIPLENIGNPSLMAVQLGDEGSLSGSSNLLLEGERYLLRIIFFPNSIFFFLIHPHVNDVLKNTHIYIYKYYLWFCKLLMNFAIL